MSFGGFNLNNLRDAERVEIGKGKTKIIYGLPDYLDYVVMENLDAIGAQDGGKTDHIEGKAKASTTITANVFKYLESKGIDTHFQEQLSDTEILVDKCDMIPLECVFRFITTGSHHRREKHLYEGKAHPDGTILDTPIMEFFYKHDVYVGEKRIADPLMQCKEGVPELDTNGSFILLEPSTGEQIDYTEVFHAGTQNKLTNDERQKDRETILKYAHDIRGQTELVGKKLKEFYKKADIELLDGKIECGINQQGNLVVADVIDADSCRLRKPTILEDTDGNRYLGKDFSKEQVGESLEGKYFTPITNLFEFTGLITNDAPPYTDTLKIIEKYCTSEPGKYKKTLSDYIDEDGKIDFKRFKGDLINNSDNNFKGTRKITRQILQDIARKKVEEFELNYEADGLFYRNENNKVIINTSIVNQAKRILGQEIKRLGEYKQGEYSRIVEGEGFDKQGYREGGDLDETKTKYDKLADISSQLLSMFGIRGVVGWAKYNAFKIVNN